MNISVGTTGVVLLVDVITPGTGYGISTTTSTRSTYAVDRFMSSSEFSKLDVLKLDITVGSNGCVTSAVPNNDFRGINYKVGQLVSVEGSSDAAICRVSYTT